MLRLIGICLTLAGSFGSGLAFCREKSRHAGTLFLLAELFWRMAEEIGYSAERLPDVFSQMSVWLAKDAENDSFGKEEASALAEALLHCADRLEQERSEPLEVVWNAELGAWAAQTVLSREEAKKLLGDKAYLEGIYKEGAQKASYLAEKTLRKVYKKVGFVAR